MYVECWVEPDGCSTTLSTPENIKYLRSRDLLSAEAVFQYGIYADDWTGCMVVHNRLQGFEEYIPFGDDEEDE